MRLYRWLIIGFVTAFMSLSSFAQEGANGFAVCSDLALQLSYEFSPKNGDDFPKVWDDFIGISLIKSGKMAIDVNYMKGANSLALVPGAPAIRADSSISREYHAHHLLIISREDIFDKRTEAKGRYAVLASPKTLEPASRSFPRYFIPMAESDAILAQIPNFDPAAQPLAFDKVDQLEREEKEQDRDTVEYLKQKYLEMKVRKAKDFLIPSGKSTKESSNGRFWVFIVVTAFALLAWLIARIIKRKRGA
ncbi:hypothetical protein HZ994_12235 [Akkermansiaceae bacterium]|nr:hypothetical protein HZ994_12235 [Akkermansiaceae bacterium]